MSPFREAFWLEDQRALHLQQPTVPQSAQHYGHHLQGDHQLPRAGHQLQYLQDRAHQSERPSPIGSRLVASELISSGLQGVASAE